MMNSIGWCHLEMNKVINMQVAIVWFPRNKWIRNRGINQNNKIIVDMVELANVSRNRRSKLSIK